MAITTATLYKAWAGITVSTFDARLAVLIPDLQDKVERYCRRVFDYSAAVTEKVDGTGTDCIYVKNGPIASIASITINYNASSSATLDSTTYTYTTDDTGRIWLYDSNRGRLALDSNGFQQDPSWGYQGGWPIGRENVTVVYAGGYGGAGATYPPSLVLSFFETISEALLFSTAGAGGSVAGSAAAVLKSKTLGKNSETYRDLDELFDKGLAARFYPWRKVLL